MGDLIEYNDNAKNLGRLKLAYTELQVDFTCYNYLPIITSCKAVGML